MRVAPFLFSSFVLASFALAGCGKGEETGAAFKSATAADKAIMASAPMAGESVQGPVRLAALPEAAPRMVVRNAELTLRVKNVERGESGVAQAAASVGGYVEASQGSDLAGPSPSMSITLRVPESRFEAAIDRLEALGTRLGKTISTDDVTAQAVDLDARIKSLRVQEDAYRAILGGVRRIPDVLEIQEKLTGVRTQIEELVAQRRDIGDQAARSKIVVTLSQAALAPAPPPEPDWLAQTWGDATGTLRGIGRSLASMALWVVAMLPIWLPLTLIAAFVYRRYRPVTLRDIQA